MLNRVFQRMASSVAAKNRLSKEKSAYLLQHASNPVDWYPWGDEAFEKAKRENKPIFLSIGYSTCHWCHVMEHESFESTEIADFLNENYISIKIDREERPDIDKQYMTFVQAMTGSGGWPSSIWLTPDLKTVMAGTYFPPDDNLYGRPGFKTVLAKFLDQWRNNRSRMEQQSKYLTETLGSASLEVLQGNTPPPADADKRLAAGFLRRFDSEYGGFSKAPKFPQPGIMTFLFRYYAKSKLAGEADEASANSALQTLEMMSRGGIYDHVGKGFHRYSTDAMWHVPHFEKMLYDQGQLAVSYSEAFMLTKKEDYARILDGIITYMLRDLRHPEGGFYCAEDADSYPPGDQSSETPKKKTEGAFYVWTYGEVNEVLKDEKIRGSPNLTLAEVFCKVFDVHPQGNVEPFQDPHDELKLKNVLIQRKPVEDFAREFSLTKEQLIREMDRACQMLYVVRDKRPRPHRDEKFVTAWNGMAISGLAQAGMALQRGELIDVAVKAAEFVKKHLVDSASGHLLRTCYAESTDAGTAQISQLTQPIAGMSIDYCCLIAGLIDLYEATLDVSWLMWAAQLQDIQNGLFWDDTAEKESFYYSNNPQLLFKLKDEQDGAEPGSNSLSCLNLLRLSDYLGRDDWRSMAEGILFTYSELISQMPIALPHMIAAFSRWKADIRHYVIASDLKDATQTKAYGQTVTSHFDPFKIICHVDEPFFAKKLPWLDEVRKAKGDSFNGVFVSDANGIKKLDSTGAVDDFMKAFRL